MDMLSREMARCERHPEWTLTIGIGDFDHFKQLNDKYGHVAGDEALRSAAAAMCSQLRKYDAIGRIGGEEFMVLLLEKDDASSGARIFERLRASVEACVISGKSELPISLTISVGYAKYEPGLDLTSFYAMADDALYEAKRLGRNGVVCYKDVPAGVRRQIPEGL
jgi:diguanylate cyclase (GGDEF)-like protein